MTKQNFRILLLWERMGDYHRARWNALSNIVGEENCLAADYGTGDALYKWDNTKTGKNYFCLDNKPVNKVGTIEAFSEFRKIVTQNKVSHVCIPGYGRVAYILMMLWAKAKGIKVLMFAESWYPANNYADLAKSILIKACTDVCFVSGKRAAHHFSNRLNYPSESIIEGYSVVDNNHFSVPSFDTPKSSKPQLLCVARHAPEKNISLLISAFIQSELAQTWQLRIVGGGPEKENLKKLIGKNDIILDEWLAYQELPNMYAKAHCFILPSKFEPWGLVVNEAMAGALPIILSDAVGALPDLLIDEKNGWSFKHNDVIDCAKTLNKLAKCKLQDLHTMGEESIKIISNYTPNVWAKKIATWIKL